MSAFSQAAALTAFECWSSQGTPRSSSTFSTSGAIEPSGDSPPLELSITSKAVCLASASANWLRHALPIHTKSTRVLRFFEISFPIPRHIEEVACTAEPGESSG